MLISPSVVALVLVWLVVLSLLVAWLMLRPAGGRAARQVRDGTRDEAFRDSIRSAAQEHGWQIEDPSSRTFPLGQPPRRAEPTGCKFAVSGRHPRDFRAETWSMKPRNSGVAMAPSFVQHRLTMPLSIALPRFAVTGESNWRTMLSAIPADLVSSGRKSGGLRVYGNDFRMADRLLPLAGQVKDAELAILVEGDELFTIREGELDAAGLARRVELATALADALEA